MNKEGREAVAKLKEEIEEVHETLSSLQSAVDDLATAEREKHENLPESLQGSERGEAMDAAASALEDAASELQDAVNAAESAALKLGEIEEA